MNTKPPSENHRADPRPDAEASVTSSGTPSMRKRVKSVLQFAAQPLLFLAAGFVLLAAVGAAQRLGWISAGQAVDSGDLAAPAAADVDYICPMMCTPPLKGPGRCPVCGMELVPVGGDAAGGDPRSIVVDPATRRVANIQTARARRIPVMRTIRSVGELRYDEGKLKVISAYTDGRFDRMYVDYTGAVVNEGDRLASFYSPELYSSQVEFLEATAALAQSQESTLNSITRTNRGLQASARKRLVEFGMSETQIQQLVREGQARSRLDIVAPMRGTVIEKLAVEGEYVKEGQPIFRLADLTSVWLILELFPEDAAAVRYGQAVEATVKSLPNQTFHGRIAFISPEVNKQSRTVSVRVVLDNSDRLLRIGDYAKAQVSVPVGGGPDQLVYDPELANKWISPRHPHVIRDQPGQCPLCGVDLQPAAEFGFTDEPQAEHTTIVVPRSAILNAAEESVVYVETEKGRFEVRRVVTGASTGDDTVILQGLDEGDIVATSGNFLLDSQMQLAGKPSLIDPNRIAQPSENSGIDPTLLAELQLLPKEDQALALAQQICPVSQLELGSMGMPAKVLVDGVPIFVCCEACRSQLLKEPAEHLAKLRARQDESPDTETVEAPFEQFEILDVPTDMSTDDIEVPGLDAGSEDSGASP